MAVTRTGLYVNTVTVGFTPLGGSLSPVARITKSSFDGGIQNISFKGDGDLFDTYQGNVSQVPSITLEGGDVGSLLNSSAGVIGTLSGIWPDARNGKGSGSYALSWSLANCQLSDKSSQSPHANLASGSNSFTAFSSDGTTNPFTFTVL